MSIGLYVTCCFTVSQDLKNQKANCGKSIFAVKYWYILLKEICRRNWKRNFVLLQVVIGDGMNLPPLTRISCVAPGRDIGNYLENISFSDNAENPDQSMYLYLGYEFTYYEF